MFYSNKDFIIFYIKLIYMFFKRKYLGLHAILIKRNLSNLFKDLNRRYFMLLMFSNQIRYYSEKMSDKQNQQIPHHDEKHPGDCVPIEKYKFLEENYKELLGKSEDYNKKFELLQQVNLDNSDEMDNLKSRLELENVNVRNFGISDFAKDLLEISDDFERANKISKEINFSNLNYDEINTKFESFVEGINLTHKLFNACLEKHGMIRYSSENENFNPHFHELVNEIDDMEKVLK